MLSSRASSCAFITRITDYVLFGRHLTLGGGGRPGARLPPTRCQPTGRRSPAARSGSAAGATRESQRYTNRAGEPAGEPPTPGSPRSPKGDGGEPPPQGRRGEGD